jgi:hypothetical protein
MCTVRTEVRMAHLGRITWCILPGRAINSSVHGVFFQSGDVNRLDSAWSHIRGQKST